MTLEMTYLLWSVILTFVLIMIPAGDALMKNGADTQAGARDNVPEPSVFNKRASRLSTNMLENMVLFAPLILIANATDISTENTVLGAQIFFYARLAHAVVYLAGWPKIRPVIWFVSVIGMGMIAIALF
ncbi:MAPEG family protein [Kordiimonas aquimaris]|uniref:MAPEG family protein n=1 Tax=Kordiimonas aquimaris TaxID=707591 RepID=UPI0021D3A97A|nr:MAPEG family protein [Kordiimonas aquimaris]